MQWTTALTALRESVYEHNRHFPPAVGFDVSIPLDRMSDAIDALRERFAGVPGQPWVVFGHLARTRTSMGT